MNSRAPIAMHQAGMSLVEMMIAMTISLVVIGAVSGVYLSSSRNYTQDEMLSRMQENARYALHVLAEDLSMAGYWGPLVTEEKFNAAARSCPETDENGALRDYCTGFYQDTTLAIDTDCGPGTVGLASNWAISLQVPIEITPNIAPADAGDDFTCINTSEFLDGSKFFPGSGINGSDILVIKRVEAQELESTRTIPDDNVGEIFLRTNGTDTMLFELADGLPSEAANSFDWRYRVNIYYIRNHFLDPDEDPQIPTLVRTTLQSGAMSTEPGGVAQGIEYFHVMFGVDEDNDGDTTADYYTASPASGDLDNITSARIYVLARSIAEDPNYENNKTYRLGDVEIDSGGDGFYRRVFSTTVILRNPRNRMSSSGT